MASPITTREAIATTREDDFFGGRLQQYWERWETWNAAPNIVEALREGFRIESDSSMWEEFGSNTIRKPEQIAWFTEQLTKMLEKKIVAEGSSQSQINPLHLVPKKGPDLFRQILDLRKINLGSTPEKFKMETLESVLKFLRSGFWATKVDLAQGYFHIPIHPDSRKLLGFIWDGITYEFQVLPFGLNSAPVIFTKVMKEVVKKWRLEGAIVFIYIDDILILGRSSEECNEITKRVITDLEYLGFLIRKEKCQLIPSQNLTFLGIQLDFKEGVVSIPTEKQSIALESIDKIIIAYENRSYLNTRWIAKVIGKLQFLTLAIPAIGVFLNRIRNQMDLVVHRSGWNSSMQIMRGAWKDFKQLRPLIVENKGNLFELDWDLIAVNTDASLTGYGAHSKELTISGIWEPTNGETEHINILEMKAVLVFFQTAVKKGIFLRGSQFHLRVDNMTALSYIRKGYGSIPHLATIARQIWILLLGQDWSIPKVSYIPSETNQIADQLSRLGEWESSEALVELVEREFGTHHVDRFASRLNSQLTTFNSFTKENDALLELWEESVDKRSYCAPPLGLISQSLVHLIKSRARATFILPSWSSASWYPVMLRLLRREISVPRSLLKNVDSSELSRNSEWSFLALDLDGALYFQ